MKYFHFTMRGGPGFRKSRDISGITLSLLNDLSSVREIREYGLYGERGECSSFLYLGRDSLAPEGRNKRKKERTIHQSDLVSQ